MTGRCLGADYVLVVGKHLISIQSLAVGPNEVENAREITSRMFDGLQKGVDLNNALLLNSSHRPNLAWPNALLPTVVQTQARVHVVINVYFMQSVPFFHIVLRFSPDPFRQY